MSPSVPPAPAGTPGTGARTPASSEATLPPALLAELRRIVGERQVIDDPERLLVYESDGLTAYRRPPAAVVLPADEAQVIDVVRALHEAGTPFVARGAGTGLSGGALAEAGAVVIGTARLNRILEVDPANRRARLQPGVVNAELTRAALPHGLQYVPDPSSQSACTIGGNVAENSGGPHCLKYGVTSRYVSGLTVVLSDGSTARLGGLGRAPDPLDLTGLFVGSEGCFGIATEIEVRLLPTAPGVRTLLAIFDTLESAGAAVTRILADGLLPAALEIIDGETIRAVEASVFAAGYPTDAGAALVIEFDGLEGGLDADADAAADACRAEGAREVRRARTEEERAALWKGRKKAFGAMGRIAPDLLVQDATVPRTRLPEVLRRIDEIGRRYDLTLANVFHAGDGNLHPNLLFDRRDPDELERVERASKEIMAVCVEAGGTITGEHGVGLDKRRYMPLVYSPAVLRRMRRAKAIFDPAGLCNPGKVLPDEGPGDGEPGRRTDAAPRGELPADGVREVEPTSEEEVAALLAAAARDGVRVEVVGGGRSVAPDGPSSGPLLRLGTARLDDMVAYDPADLTLTARAGIPLSRLQAQVRAEGQWLPTETPLDGRPTLGGWVARGEPGFLSTAFGAPRDLVLGATVVDGTGTMLRLGGRVVKNVAGFDLLRPVVGSGGRLGVVTEVTVRLLPRPKVDRTLLYEADAERAAAAAVRGPLLVAAAALLGGTAAPGPDAPSATVAVRLLGGAEEVDEAAEVLARSAGRPGEVLEGPASEAFWWDVAGPAERGVREEVRYALPADVGRVAEELGGSGGGAGWAADLHTGRIRVWRPAEEAPGERADPTPAAPSDAAVVRGMRSHDVRGAAADLAERLRREFDPAGVLGGPRQARDAGAADPDDATRGRE